MHQKYLELFREVVHTTEVLSEKVIDYNKSKNDDKGVETATTMRDDYAKLYDAMRGEAFDPNTLTKSDYAKFLVGVMIVVNNIESRITSEKKAVNNYKTDIIPKLQRIVDECKTDEEVVDLAKNLFTIEESK